MSNFNFGSIASAEVKTTSYLKAYNIYKDVKFTGVDDAKTGISDKGNSWKSWAFHFSCPEGEFIKSIFEPKDEKRPEYTNAQGHKYQAPSGHESNLAFLLLVGQYFDPEGLEKMKKNMSKVTDYDSLIKLFKLCIATNKGTTSMKLVGRNTNGNVYADMPKYCGINKEGVWFPIANSVFGDKVAFTAYEKNKMEEVTNAKPSDIAAEVANEDPIDIDGLDLEL